MYKSFLALFVLTLGLAALLIIGCLNVAQEPLTSNMLEGPSCSTERLLEEDASFLRRHPLDRSSDAQFVTAAVAARPDLQQVVNA
jgi:hypothetical protein